MADINAEDFLNEIAFDIKSKDPMKAIIVLSSLGEVSDETGKQALFELNRADDEFAIPVLAYVIAKNPNLGERFPLLKETLFSRVLDSPQVLLDLLSNGENPSKAFLAEVAGEIRLEEAVPVLLKILTDEEDLKAIEAAILSLGMIGAPSATAAVGEYLYSGNSKLVCASVRTLGRLGSPTATKRLAERVGRDSDLDLMILDVFAKIQTPEALEKLNETLGSHHAHLRTAGKQKLIEVGVKAVPILINNLLHDDPGLLIHSLNVLGQIADDSALVAIRKLLHNEPGDANVRFAAYEALGRLPLEKGAYMLAAGLEDPVDNVRTAAAKAVDRNYNSVLAAGIKNMIRGGGAEALKITITVIDSQCENIFFDLLEEDFFRESGLKYLTDKAHPDIRSHFAKALEKNGHRDLAKQIVAEETPEVGDRLKVFAVDDSRMVLSIYRSVLHNLGCEPHLFEFPAGAMERIQKEKPDLVLTDLNMPDITGIDLTKGVREWFSEEELPIVMVTTQNEAQDNEAAYAAGVSVILYKPFTEEQIGKILSELFEKF